MRFSRSRRLPAGAAMADQRARVPSRPAQPSRAVCARRSPQPCRRGTDARRPSLQARPVPSFPCLLPRAFFIVSEFLIPGVATTFVVVIRIVLACRSDSNATALACPDQSGLSPAPPGTRASRSSAVRIVFQVAVMRGCWMGAMSRGHERGRNGRPCVARVGETGRSGAAIVECGSSTNSRTLRQAFGLPRQVS